MWLTRCVAVLSGYRLLLGEEREGGRDERGRVVSRLVFGLGVLGIRGRVDITEVLGAEEKRDEKRGTRNGERETENEKQRTRKSKGLVTRNRYERL